MTWADLWRAIYGYDIRQEREWDRTRQVLAMLYNTRRGKRGSKKPSDLVPLTLDRLRKVRLKWTEGKKEQFKQALKAWHLVT